MEQNIGWIVLGGFIVLAVWGAVKGFKAISNKGTGANIPRDRPGNNNRK